MKVSQLFFKTYKEIPAEAEIKSHILMTRASYIKRMATGVYSYLPLGYKALNNLEKVIREEMDKIGCQELLMPSLLPQEYYKSRLDKFGSDMFKFNDRQNKDMCLAPTHEEIFTIAAKDLIKTYKQLPVILYQIQNKFRDEARPRYGLMRVREFFMKDAYSFDKDKEGLDKAYDKMAVAYNNIFKRLGLDYIVVNADNGTMGGNASQEFMVKSEVGDDTIIVCECCDYSSNEEKAESVVETCEKEEMKSLEKMITPQSKTIEELTKFLNTSAKKFVKSLVYKIDDKFVLAMVRGDREVQETKLKNIFGANNIELASSEDVERITGSIVGFAGPINLKEKVTIVADEEIPYMYNFIVGANEKDHHLINVNYNRDFVADKVVSIRKAVAGDTCCKCGKKLNVMKGIEVGHIFKFGRLYSDKLGSFFLDENGVSQPLMMGSYGIGVGRTFASIIEQKSDDKGIILPFEIAPYKACVFAVSNKDEIQINLANSIYSALNNKFNDILIDDRNDSFGSKLKDLELIGVPYIIICGKKANEKIVELIERATNEKFEINANEVVDFINSRI